MTAAKLFKNGRSQAVRLPAEFRFEGSEVDVKRDPVSGGVILASKVSREKSWARFVEILKTLDVPDDFMAERDQGVQERDDPLA